MRRYVRLTKEEGLELKKMQQEAGLNCSEAATCMSSDVSQIKAFERGEVGIDPYFLERLKKRYKLIAQYKNI
jgi:hypothetical protein